MSTLKTHSEMLTKMAANLDTAGYRNAADQLEVIARDLVRWDELMNAIYEETTAEIAEVENRLGGRRLAIMTGNIVHLRGPR